VLATAYGKVDVAYANNKDIIVCNIPGYATEAVAEFVFAVILDHIREVERGKKQARERNYSEVGFSAIEIKNKVFGIFGLGKIGSRVAEIALGFGADVRYWNIDRKKDFETKGIKYEKAGSLIPKCDFLSLHFAQVKNTENFLNEEKIQKIKKGAVVINTAPMELVSINALEKRLKSEDITFILDHSDEMSPGDIKRLSKLKNCIIYPPIAYITKEARIAKQEIFVRNIENFLKGHPTNQAN
jgi:lactate dehydrogenase-like 2-hydroxyacid dehydrogenase